MRKPKSLNKLDGYLQTGCGINNESGYGFNLKNYKAYSNAAEVEVVFDDISERLIELIQQYDVAVGCVAWLTNFKILKALEKCEWANIVVQKEDFLRNDSLQNRNSWKPKLRAAYDSIRGKDLSMNIPDLSIGHPHFNRRVQQCCVRADGVWSHYMESIRCLGYAGGANNITPKMHHKFLVLGHADEDVDIIPDIVWTGSFNFTQNAESSRENGLIIRDHSIVHSYLSEWAQIWAMSEKLNWQSEEPERADLYVGT